MRFVFRFLLMVPGIMLLLCMICPVSATTYYVTTDGSDGAAGTNWALAFLTISNAVAQTIDGDTVIVSNGTYNIDVQITITNAITVQSTNGALNTIVKRSTAGGGNPRHRIFYVKKSSAVLDGFTITNGYFDTTGGGVGGDGAGVYLQGGTVKNCVITDNYADRDGIGRGSGIYINGGTVENCTIRGNGFPASGAYYSGPGGGVYINVGGTVKNCTIIDNATLYKGGGVYMLSGGVVRNCLISGNKTRGPGGVYMTGGTVENCTITDNLATGGGGGVGGGGVGGNGGTIKNSIIYFNTAPPGWGDNWAGTVTYSYSCTTPAVGGTSNTTTDPLFVDAATDNYRLLPGSPCTDAGQSNSWMNSSTDLDGTNRIIGATVDFGAYEFAEGDLICGFGADPLEGFDPHTVILSGYVSGSDTNGLIWLWDVNNDGSIDYQGPAAAVVTNVYTSGVYTVSLTVTNAAGESNTYARASYIKVGPGTNYVDAASASPAFPYASWATASTNIQAAIDAGLDGTLVLVTNGTYEVSSQVSLTKGITVRSVNGADVTTIRAMADVLSAFLKDQNAVIDGFTLTKGPQANGGRVTISYAGTVRNCIIKGNKGNTSWGNAVSMKYGGTVSDCVITGNTNTYGGAAAYPGGVYVYAGGTLRNCLISDNSTAAGGAAGVYLSSLGGVVESCTITGNRAVQNNVNIVGGLSMNNGTVRNCIIYANTNTTTGSGVNWYKTGGTVSYTCTTPAIGGTANITNDPSFKKPDADNYRLTPTSPCVDAGVNVAWMIGADDLFGDERIIGGTVDIGAYESYRTGTVIVVR